MRDPAATEDVAALRIHLLGDPRVVIGERVISGDAWRLRKAWELFKLLALAPDHRLARPRALDLLWPEPDVGSPAQAFYKAVHVLRRTLEPERPPAARSAYLSFERGVLAFRAGLTVWVDIEAFEATAVVARRSRELQAYQAALALYAGDLTVEDESVDMLAARSEELRALHATLLAELAHLHVLRGDREEAILTLHRLIVAEPTREDACQALMGLYLRAGRPYEALRQYQHVRDALRRVLDVEPDPATRRLYETIQRSRSTGTAPPTPPCGGAARTDRDAPWNATAEPAAPGPIAARQPSARGYVTSFIGRRRERAEVARMLTTARLVTVTRAGGAGKTRLAERVATEVEAGYRDGVVPVPLAALTDPRLVPSAVASLVGVRAESSRAITEALADALRTRETLLVLDNCEHLRAACAELAEMLLARCPGLRILATSRRALGIARERVWRVPPLGLPNSEHLPPLDDLATYDAIHLFLERAALSRPGYCLTPEHALAVVGICRRLDGLPLAIELAAGRVRFLTPEQILARLDTCFSLLADGAPDIVPRQRTMRTVIEWSYALLAEPERVLLRRLSVFAGGWTLEAAEEVCAGDGLPRAEMLPLLGRLVDQSLVVAEERGEVMRYGLLEVIRQFAASRLAHSGEAAGVRQRHAEWCRRLAEDAEPHLTGPDQHDRLATLDGERENLRAALGWSLAEGDRLVGLRLAAALLWYWYSRGMLSEGRRWLEDLLAASSARAALPLAARARALGAIGVLAAHLGDHPRALAAAEEALPAAREVGDVFGMLRALAILGDVAEAKGDYARLTALAERAVPLARTLDKPHALAVALSNLGDAEWKRGNIERAEEHFQECLAIARAGGDTRSTAMALANLGRVAHRRGAFPRAIVSLEEAARLFGGLGDLRGTADAFVFHAAVLRDRGDARAAIGRYLEGLALYERAGCHGLFAEYLPGLAAALAGAGRCRDAARALGAAEALRERLGLALDAAERATYERTLATIRAALSAEAGAAAWIAGRAMSPAQILAELAAEPPTTPPASASRPLADAPMEQPSPRRHRNPAVDPASLTPRQREIAALVGGLTNAAIAARLNLTTRTIDTHVTRILAKTGSRNRRELAIWMAAQQPPEAERA